MQDYSVYIEELKNKVTPKRFTHCINVAEAAAELAEIYGADQEKAKIAGLLHDIAKEIPWEDQLIILQSNGFSLEDFEKFPKRILHGFTGSIYVKQFLNIHDDEILNAIRYHTTGRADMALLEKIIFVADYISEERTFEGVAVLRAAASRDLDKAVLEKLIYVIRKCIESFNIIHPYTLSAYNATVLKCYPEVQSSAASV